MKINTFNMTPHQLARLQDIMKKTFKTHQFNADLKFLSLPLPSIDVTWYLKFMNNKSKMTPNNVKLTIQQQTALFNQYDYFRSKVNEIKQQLSDDNVMEMLAFHEKAMKVRQVIIDGNLTALVKFASDVKSKVEFDLIISDAQPVLIAAVDCYNINSGYRFSTYLVNSLKNSFGRTIKSGAKYYARNSELKTSDGSANGVVHIVKQNKQKQLQNKEFIKTALALLTKDQLLVISKRYFDSNKKTTEELGEELNCSRQNISQIEKRALKKMRQYAGLQGVLQV